MGGSDQWLSNASSIMHLMTFYHDDMASSFGVFPSFFGFDDVSNYLDRDLREFFYPTCTRPLRFVLENWSVSWRILYLYSDLPLKYCHIFGKQFTPPLWRRVRLQKSFLLGNLLLPLYCRSRMGQDFSDVF